MNICLCLLHGWYSSTESTKEPAGTSTSYQSLLWSLLDILLGSLLYSLIESLLAVCMSEQRMRAVPARWILQQELSFPHDGFGSWKSVSLWKVWHKCWWTESTCLIASGTMITITNTIIIITIITISVILLPIWISALDWMCTHIPPIGRLQVGDFGTNFESQDPIFNFFCRIYNCDFQYHDYKALWDPIVVGTIKIWFTL